MENKILTLIHFTINKKNYVANTVAVTVRLQVSIHDTRVGTLIVATIFYN